MDKVKKHAATVEKRATDEHKQTVVTRSSGSREVEAERHRQRARDRKAAFEQANGTAVRFPDSKKRRGLLEVWTSSTTSSLCRLPMSGVGALEADASQPSRVLWSSGFISTARRADRLPDRQFRECPVQPAHLAHGSNHPRDRHGPEH